MPWKVGGNFETAWITCETNWKECAMAVVNYVWFEIVSDVVDCLAKEGMIWIIAIAVTTTILFRIKCHKNERKHTENTINKQTLSKVGCKLQDLELKINVLTYKMQYGTWPLPHQIYNLNPTKLQKIRMTLSNPDDRKSWIKRILLSPMRSAVYSDIFNDSSVRKLTNFSDVKRKPALRQIQRDKLSMDYSTEISTSDQSVNVCSQRPSTYLKSMTTRENELPKSNFTLQRHDDRPFLPLDQFNHRSSKCVSLRAKDNPCQEFAGTMRKCKSFLKECNGRRLHLLNYSSERGGTSLRDGDATKPAVLLTTEEGNKTDEAKRARETTRSDETLADTDEVHRRSNVHVVPASNDAFLKQLFPILPISQPASRNTLYEVRQRLRSLHNVLRTYENTSRFCEEYEPIDPTDETDNVLVTVASKIQQVAEDKIDTNLRFGATSRRDSPRARGPIVGSCEYFKFDHSEESSSTLVSNKTYRCSNDTLWLNNHSEEQAPRNAALRPAWTNNLNVFTNDCRRSSYRSVVLHTPRAHCEDRRAEDECERAVSDRELRSNGEIHKKAMITADASSELKEEKLVAASPCCVLPSKDEEIQAPDCVSSTSKIDVERFSELGDRHREDTMISRSSSQSKVSRRNEKERKSTVLLLQEALLFKKALLTRAESEKKCSVQSAEMDVSSKSLLKYGTKVDGNSDFPLMMIDIKTEDSPIDTSHGKLNQRYVHLEMKQRRDLLPPTVRNVENFAPCENDTDVANEDPILGTPSKYFSVSDLATRGSNEVQSNAPSEPPAYEKVVSITIPVDAKCQNAIDAHEKTMRIKTAVLGDSRAISQKDLREETISIDDVDSNNIVDKPPSTMLKLEDLILERVKNIRDYIDTFLHNQNKAFSQARRALRDLNESDTFRCLNQASHVILHNRLLASSGFCDGTDQIANFSKGSQPLDLFVNQLPICKQRRIFVEDGESPSNISKYSKLTTHVNDSHLTLDESDHDYSTDARTKGSNNDEPARMYLTSSSLDIDEETSNADDRSLNSIKLNERNKMPTVNAHNSIKRLHQTRQSRIKAKSDVSLMTRRTTKESHVNLRPKRSHSSLRRCDTLERIRRILYQSDVKKENELRAMTSSKSILPSEKISAKSYIPILKDQLGATKAKHRTHTRSPTRGPLTMLWREKIHTKDDRATDDEATRKRNSTSMDKCVDMKKTALDSAGVNTGRNVLAERLEEINATCRDSNVTAMDRVEILSSDQILKLSVINEQHTDKKFISSSKSDTHTILSKHLESATPKAVTIISTLVNDNLRKRYPTNSSIVKVENVKHSTSELLKQKTELCAIAVETKEKEITAKPSITDTCTSMSDIRRIN